MLRDGAGVTLVVTFGGPVGVVHSGNIARFSVSGAGLGSAAVFVGPSSVSYDLRFDQVAPVDFVFDVANSGGGKGYELISAPGTVVNNTGRPWHGYRLEIGFGTGSSFVPSTPSDGLGFLSNPVPSSFGSFKNLDHTTASLAWSGGIVPSPGGVDFAFPFTVPDGRASFTLRQIPAIGVPEPSSPVPSGSDLGGLGRIAWGRRRRKSS